jgi:hypothetical protein
MKVEAIAKNQNLIKKTISLKKQNPKKKKKKKKT